MARCERQYEMWDNSIDHTAAVSRVLRPITDARLYSAVVPSREHPTHGGTQSKIILQKLIIIYYHLTDT